MAFTPLDASASHKELPKVGSPINFAPRSAYAIKASVHTGSGAFNKLLALDTFNMLELSPDEFESAIARKSTSPLRSYSRQTISGSVTPSRIIEIIVPQIEVPASPLPHSVTTHNTCHYPPLSF